MAGTLFGLGLSQQSDATGTPHSGALLYIYEENSSTPVETYADFSLSTVQTFPIEADSAGRLPQIWVEDGSYRARLTTSAGIEIFDEASVTAIGASSSSGGGSSGGTSVDAAALFETGDVKWRPITGSLTGWVRANGRTIGSGSSGATERANADTQSLFEYLWNNLSNSICAVSSGRGASATADFNANKTLTLYSMRGKGMFGLDDMGNTAAGVIVGNTPTAAATGGGAETTTISQANLPNYNLDVSALDVLYDQSTITSVGGSGTRITSLSSAGAVTGTNPITGTLNSGGSGTAFNKMPPYLLGSVYIKL